MVKKREFQGEISAGKFGEKILVKAFINDFMEIPW